MAGHRVSFRRGWRLPIPHLRPVPRPGTTPRFGLCCVVRSQRDDGRPASPTTGTPSGHPPSGAPAREVWSDTTQPAQS
jgi:hypothetical protein